MRNRKSLVDVPTLLLDLVGVGRSSLLVILATRRKTVEVGRVGLELAERTGAHVVLLERSWGEATAEKVLLLVVMRIVHWQLSARHSTVRSLLGVALDGIQVQLERGYGKGSDVVGDRAGVHVLVPTNQGAGAGERVVVLVSAIVGSEFLLSSHFVVHGTGLTIGVGIDVGARVLVFAICSALSVASGRVISLASRLSLLLGRSVLGDMAVSASVGIHVGFALAAAALLGAAGGLGRGLGTVFEVVLLLDLAEADLVIGR